VAIEIALNPDDDDGKVSINQLEPSQGVSAVMTLSGCRVTMTTRMQESHYQRAKKWVSWAALALRPLALSKEDESYEISGDWEYNIHDRASDPITFSATSDPDTMYWHQAMQEPDKAEFIKAGVSEVKSHVDNQYLTLIR
jgi:hypothetical protein